MERPLLIAASHASTPGLDFEPVSSSPGFKVGCAVTSASSNRTAARHVSTPGLDFESVSSSPGFKVGCEFIEHER
jgi:hypothetical protein